MGWGLQSNGFDWQEEVERLESGVFAGTYELLDLRNTSQTKNPAVVLFGF